MKTLLTILFASLIFLPAQAQSVSLSGTVVEQNSLYSRGALRTVEGATIKAGDVTATSDASGRFTLNVPKAPYGNVTWIQVEKSGYELINASELRQAMVSGRKEPLKVVLCSAAQLKASQIYFSKAIELAYLNAYKEKRAILEAPGPDRDQFLNQMRLDLNRNIQDEREAISMLEARLRFSKKSKAKELAEQLLLVNLDDRSEAYQKVFYALIEENSISKALQTWEGVDLGRESPRSTPLAVLGARLYKLNDQFQKADSTYALALRIAPANQELAEEYAAFLMEEGQDFRAKKVYADLVAHCRKLTKSNPELYSAALAAALNSQGGHSFSEKNYARAQKELEEAFAIRKGLVEKNPYAFGVDASGTAIVLAILQYQLLESTDDGKHYIAGMQYLASAYEYLGSYAETSNEIVIYLRAIEEYRSKYQALSPEEEDRKRKLLEQEAAVKTEKDPLKKVLKQKELIRLQETYAGEGEMSLPLKAAIGNEYGSLAWFQLFSKEFAHAEKSARKGMEMAPREDWIVTNLVLALLYQGKWEQAKALYLELKDLRYKDGTYGQAFLSDLAELEAAGITHGDVEKARGLLK